MASVEDLTVVLLAGGRSKRMGKDKALLEWQGEPLLKILAERFQAAGYSVLIAGGFREWSQRLKDIPFTVLSDLPSHEGFGPLAGIEAGLLHTRAKVIGVVACDLPYAEPKLISWLAKKLTYAEAVIPVVNGEPQPLHAVYARSCLPKLVAQLESHDKSVMAFLNQIKAIYVPEVEWQVIADTRCLKVHINEPEDLVHWQACEIELKSSNVPILAFIGFSGAGKTPLIEKLTKALTENGYKVGVIKHHAHVDDEGKDTWRYKEAGAAIVGLVAPNGMALLLPKRGLTLQQALEKLLRQEDLDLVLVEGFKGSRWRKIAVLPHLAGETEAQQLLQELLAQVPDKETVIGVVSPVRLATQLPQFTHDDIEKLCSFIQSLVVCEGKNS